METVTIQSLSKTYTGGKEALKAALLVAECRGSIRFLGPNGAGKNNNCKNFLPEVLTPSGGSCEILGVNPHTQPEKAHLLSGIVTEHAQMYNNLTGIENLLFYATAFGLKQKEGEQRGEIAAEGIRSDGGEGSETGYLFYRYETETLSGTGIAASAQSSFS